MSCYSHLTIEEREKLYAFTQFPEKMSIRKMAGLIGRSPSTVSRELQRNKGCLPSQAQKQYLERRKKCVRKAILSNPDLHEQVHFFLGYLFWSPEEIANRFRMEGKYRVSTSTIYRALDNGVLQDTLRFYLRIKYKRSGRQKNLSGVALSTLSRTGPKLPTTGVRLATGRGIPSSDIRARL